MVVSWVSKKAMKCFRVQTWKPQYDHHQGIYSGLVKYTHAKISTIIIVIKFFFLYSKSHITKILQSIFLVVV